jgi:hypothetical protein
MARLHRGAPIPGTFDGSIAHESPRLELFTLRHPLIRAAADHFRLGQKTAPALPLVDLQVPLNALPADLAPWPAPGDYRFVLYLLGLGGVQRQTRLVPIAFDALGRRAHEVEDRLLRMVQDHAVDAVDAGWSADERDDLADDGRRAMAAVSDQLRAEAAERNEGWLAVRRATLERTLRGKIAKRRTLLAEANDERIVRMRAAEIENIQADLARRLAELDRQREVTAEFSPIGMGRLRVLETHEEAAEAPATPTGTPEPAPAPAHDEVISGFPEPPPVFHG